MQMRGRTLLGASLGVALLFGSTLGVASAVTFPHLLNATAGAGDCSPSSCSVEAGSSLTLYGVSGAVTAGQMAFTVSGATFTGATGNFTYYGSVTPVLPAFYPAGSVGVPVGAALTSPSDSATLTSASQGTATITEYFWDTTNNTWLPDGNSYAVTFTAPVVTPATKGDCQHGGWANSTDAQGTPFTSQSQCMKWVKANT